MSHQRNPGSRLLKFTSLDDEILKRYWMLLQENNPSCSVFQTHHWLCEWEKAYGGDHDVEVWVEIIGDTPVALVPLMVQNDRVRFLSCNCSDYAGIITPSDTQIKPTLLLDELSFLIQEKKHWLFWNMPIDSIGFHFLTEMLKDKNIKFNRRQFRDFKIDLTNLTQYQYWQSVGSNLRRNNKRSRIKINNLNIHFSVNYDVTQDEIDQMGLLHIKRWKDKGIRSSYLDNRRRQFIYSLTKLQDPFRKLVAFTLRDDNHIVAYRFGFLDGQIYRDWNTSFDVAYYQFSPGLVLMGYIIDYLFSQQLSCFDFLRGEEEYKAYWANTSSVIATFSQRK